MSITSFDYYVAFEGFTNICYNLLIILKGVIYMHSNESSENYLETILTLSKKLPVVRSVDVANELGFKKPSVSIAMKNLREKGHITVTEQGYIYLTESGKQIADSVYERHQCLSLFFEKLGVPKDIAVEDACRIEHIISNESFDAIKKHIKLLK